jgi:hypothetical protein
MDDEAVVEAERRRILNTLDLAFGRFRLAELSEVVEEFEALIERHCALRVRELLAAFSDVRAVEHGAYLLGPYDEYYELTVTRDVREAGTLLVTLLARSPAPDTEDRVVSRSRALAGYGQYRTLELVMAQRAADHATLVADIVVAIVESGYAWIRGRIDSFVSQDEVALGGRLYSYMRNIFPTPEVSENLWFAVLTEEYGFRLIDPEAVDRAFGLMETHARAYGHSPTQLVAELLQTRLPRERLLMHRALALGQCIDVDLADADYRKEGAIYATALASLYGSDAFTIFPLREDGRFSILALFPTGMPIIRERLTAHREELIAIASSTGQEVKEAERLFEKDRRWREGLKDFYEEAILLRPSFFGMGVDLKEIFRRLSPSRVAGRVRQIRSGSDTKGKRR